MPVLTQSRRRAVRAVFDRAFWLTAVGAVSLGTGVALGAILANERVNVASVGNAERARVGQARRFAIYLTVVHFGMPQARLARAAGMTRQQVSLACQRTEDAREEPAVDEVLDAMAGALPPLTALASI